MSDEELRERERRWLTTGALEDGVALLRERLRAGSLPADRLELAAWLGHPAARALLGPEAPAGRYAVRAGWLCAFDREGVRGLLDARRRELASVVLHGEPGGEEAQSEGLRSLDLVARLLGPELAGPEARALVEHLAEQARREKEHSLLELGSDRAMALSVLHSICEVVAAWLRGEASPRAGWLLGLSAEERLRLAVWATGLAAQGGVDPSTTQEAAWLAARLARGDLTRARLQLAAWAGSAAASQALASPLEAPGEPERWVQGLLDLDPGEASRCALRVVESTGIGPSLEERPGATRRTFMTTFEGVRLARRLSAVPAPSDAAEQAAAHARRLRESVAELPPGEAAGVHALAVAMALESIADPRRAPAAVRMLLEGWSGPAYRDPVAGFKEDLIRRVLGQGG